MKYNIVCNSANLYVHVCVREKERERLSAFEPRFTADRGECLIYCLFLYHFNRPHFRIIFISNLEKMSRMGVCVCCIWSNVKVNVRGGSVDKLGAGISALLLKSTNGTASFKVPILRTNHFQVTAVLV